MTTLFFDEALLPDGWATGVRVDIVDGRIARVASGQKRQGSDHASSVAVPGLGNVHSHAFQRGMAGLAEQRGPDHDSFWTWREIMYRFVEQLSPDDLTAIAALAYVEMLESGFTRVGEFHYIHHPAGSGEFANPAEMSDAILAAAAETGIALTLLPVFYAHSAFGGQAPTAGQRRFVCGVDGFARIVESARSSAKRGSDAVVGIAPHSLRAVTQDELLAIANLADHAPIHLHIAEQSKEVDDCIAWSGRRPVEWLFDNLPIDRRWCLVHATHVVPDELRRIVEAQSVVGLCPITEANLGDGVFPLTDFLDAGGYFAVGSDSNILIDATEELRLLEYGQRLRHQRRNLVARNADEFTGDALFRRAASGAEAALGCHGGIAVGQPADIVALNGDHPSLVARNGPALLNGYIFSAGRSAVETVWRGGRKVVAEGRHVARGTVEARYQKVLRQLLA